MTTLKASDARSKLYRLMDEAASSHEPVLITGKRHNAVLVSEEDWRSIEETLFLLSVPGMRESILEGMAEPLSQVPKDPDMVKWRLVYTGQAQKDAKKLSAVGLKDKARELLDVLESNPFQNPPPYEKLVGDLKGAYSRRINIQHRLVYQVYEKERVVKVIRLWSHYE